MVRAKGPLSEDEAVRLFAAHAEDARGAPVVTEGDEPIVRRIVALLSYNRAAIQLAAARATEMSPADIARALEQLDIAETPEPEIRARLSRGESGRELGRLTEAATDLEAVLREAEGDPHAEAEAHRLLGAVYRTQGRLREALVHKEKALVLFTTLGDEASRAVVQGEIGTVLAALGRLRQARECHERALAAHRELGQQKHEGVELSYLGVTLHRLGLWEEARRAHGAALVLHRATGHRRLEGADRLHLAYVAHQLGEFDEARAAFDDALLILREVGDRALEGVCLSFAGALEVEAARPEAAGPLLFQALAIHAEVGSPRHEAITWMHLESHHAALGEAEKATAALVRSLALCDGDASIETEHRAWILALLGRSDEARAIDVEDACTARAIALLFATGPVVRDARTSSRIRRASRTLDEAIARTGASLEVARDGRWFSASGGERVDLSRRRPLRLALLSLTERRLSAPGEGISWELLLAAAWPGERVQTDAGFARVRNALFQLRKAGIREALITRDDGYLLDPAVAVRWADTETLTSSHVPMVTLEARVAPKGDTQCALLASFWFFAGFTAAANRPTSPRTPLLTRERRRSRILSLSPTRATPTLLLPRPSTPRHRRRRMLPVPTPIRAPRRSWSRCSPTTARRRTSICSMGAKSSIRVLGYEMGTGAVLDSLIAQAKAGIDVRVILDGVAQKAVNDKYRVLLEAAGTKFEWSDPKFTYMHAKMMVADDKIGIVSTGNYTKSYILKERNYVATITDPQDVRDLAGLFDADWAKASPNLVVHAAPGLAGQLARSLGRPDRERAEDARCNRVDAVRRQGDRGGGPRAQNAAGRRRPRAPRRADVDHREHGVRHGPGGRRYSRAVARGAGGARQIDDRRRRARVPRLGEHQLHLALGQPRGRHRPLGHAGDGEDERDVRGRLGDRDRFIERISQPPRLSGNCGRSHFPVCHPEAEGRRTYAGCRTPRGRAT